MTKRKNGDIFDLENWGAPDVFGALEESVTWAVWQKRIRRTKDH